MNATPQESAVTEIRISGMRCDGCAEAVHRALSAVSGVRRCEVDLTSGVATVHGAVELESLVAAVRNAGFNA